MNVIFIHQNFPGQFLHIARQLTSDPKNQVISICQSHAPKLAEVPCLVYKPVRGVSKGIHHYLASTEQAVLNGQAVAKLLLELKQKGFVPDAIFAHAAWGEALYVKDVFPDVPLIGYFEFFYRAQGADVGFDPEYPSNIDSIFRLRTRNATHLLTLQAADYGITPTAWQKSVFPREFHSKLHQIHDGVDSAKAAPDAKAEFQLADGRTLTTSDEVITYASRNLEPYRGFHIFMRAVEEICRRRSNAQFLIMGGDQVSYGTSPTDGRSYREVMLEEVDIDTSRVHFLGRIPHPQYIKALQVSSAHVYLTIPFVLSWSMLEAMSTGCLVIASDTPPVAEVITHEKNGLLVDFFSPLAIADAVDKALQSPQTMQPLRAAARRHILKNYAVDKCLRQYRDLLSKLGKAPARKASRK
jgi:glycosyltransferase involved in cell wall biosynthesis